MENWLADGTDPITNYTYDSYGNVISEIDANAHTTIYEYGPGEGFYITKEMIWNLKVQLDSQFSNRPKIKL